MADILIRGMEMPPDGKSICIEIFSHGGVHEFGKCYPCALAYEVKTPTIVPAEGGGEDD